MRRGELMASRRQIEANRRNARKSTGPKSRAGKRRASNNAIRHGFHRKIETEEVLPYCEKIAADDDFTIDALLTKPRARLAFQLAEAEARLNAVIKIEQKVWDDLSGEAAALEGDKSPIGSMTTREVTDAIREEFDIETDPQELKGQIGRILVSSYKTMLRINRKELKPSLARRYRKEAEANRQHLLKEWIEGIDS